MVQDYKKIIIPNRSKFKHWESNPPLAPDGITKYLKRRWNTTFENVVTKWRKISTKLRCLIGSEIQISGVACLHPFGSISQYLRRG